MSKTPKHILVIRLSAMGDVAMTVPVLRAFASDYPDVKITLLTRAHFAPFFRDIEQVTVFPIDVKGKHKGILGLYKLAGALKTLHIEAVADLHNVLRTQVLKLFLFRKPFIQINKGRAEKKALISGRSFHQLQTTHERYADVFRRLGFTMDLTNPLFPRPSELSETTRSITGDKNQKWIGVAPFATYPGKMYPQDAMEAVISELSKTSHIFLFGGGDEEVKILNALASQYNNVINVAGNLTMHEELDVISNLDVMLAMDSGNAHMAAMLGVKVITLWGVTHPYAGFAPFNQPEDFALTSNRETFPDIPTSIYGNKYPENYREASRSISTQKVTEKVRSIL